jgi:hypothetical protein
MLLLVRLQILCPPSVSDMGHISWHSLPLIFTYWATRDQIKCSLHSEMGNINRIVVCSYHVSDYEVGCLWSVRHLYKTPSLSRKYSLLLEGFPDFRELQKESCFCSSRNLSLSGRPSSIMAPTCRLKASTWLILVPALCSITKSNSDKLRLHRIIRELLSAKLRR